MASVQDGAAERTSGWKGEDFVVKYDVKDGPKASRSYELSDGWQAAHRDHRGVGRALRPTSSSAASTSAKPRRRLELRLPALGKHQIRGLCARRNAAGRNAPALALQLVISPTSTCLLSVYRSMRTRENAALSARATASISRQVSGLGACHEARVDDREILFVPVGVEELACMVRVAIEILLHHAGFARASRRI